MAPPPTPSTASSEESSPSPHPDKPPHPVHSIYPIFVPTDLSDDFIHAFAGASAGFASGVVTCPLDVIKTKLQAQGGWSIRHGRGVTPSEVVYRGLFGTANKIWSDEGFRGMYRGLGPLILGYLPTWTVYFTVYEKTKGVLEPEIEKTWVKHILSAMAAGASSTICTNPIWVIKTRLMAQSSPVTSRNAAAKIPYHYTGTLDAMRKMYAHEGIRSFYSGLAPALLGLTHVAVQFPLYEQFKKMFTGGVELGKQGKSGETDFWGILAASFLSKICASSATYPHEVIRTRLQTQRIENGKQGYPRYRGIVQSFKTVFRDEGWRGFYAGMGTNMIRAVPASAMTLLTYELMVGRLTLWKNQGILERDERWPDQVGDRALSQLALRERK